jgi:hypothetical protein
LIYSHGQVDFQDFVHDIFSSYKNYVCIEQVEYHNSIVLAEDFASGTSYMNSDSFVAPTRYPYNPLRAQMSRGASSIRSGSSRFASNVPSSSSYGIVSPITAPTSPLMTPLINGGHRLIYSRPPRPPEVLLETSRQQVNEDLFQKHQQLQYGYKAVKPPKMTPYYPLKQHQQSRQDQEQDQNY